METGLEYYQKFNFNSMSTRPFEDIINQDCFMLLPNATQREFNEYIFVILNESSTSYLIFEEENEKLPSAILLPFGEDSIYHAIEIVTFPNCFQKSKDIKYKINGALMVNYDGKSRETDEMSLHDGLQIVILVQVLNKDFSYDLKENFKWRHFSFTEVLEKNFYSKINNDFSFVKVIIT